MKKKPFFRRLNVSIFALFVMLGISTTTHAGVTYNPVELISDGGFTFNRDVSTTTKLFLDTGGPNGQIQFWVRVENNPGVPPNPTEQFQGPDGEIFSAPAPLTKTVSIKYFPMFRFIEVLRATRGIETFGNVNPYVDGFIICDAPNTTIRIWDRSIFMAYNCGSSGPDADESTFRAEELINALRAETIAEPDLEGDIPQ